MLKKKGLHVSTVLCHLGRRLKVTLSCLPVNYSLKEMLNSFIVSIYLNVIEMYMFCIIMWINVYSV